MKKILLTFASLCLAVTAGVMAANGLSAQSEDARQTAKRLVEDIFSSYSQFSLPRFEGMISQDFTPPRAEFMNGVQSSFYGNQLLEMNFFLQSALGNEDKLSADFRWEKKVIPRINGQVTLKRGRARFVFKNEEGQWRLTEIKGQDPFAA